MFLRHIRFVRGLKIAIVLLIIALLAYVIYPAGNMANVNLLRVWVYDNTVVGDGATWKAQETYGKNIFWIYNYYRENKGGAKCNNVAYFYRLILTALKYRVFEYHFGDLNGFNHVINLVRVKENGKYIYTVQDAYYNMTFRDNEGKLLDFFRMRELIREKKYNQIYIDPLESEARRYLVDIGHTDIRRLPVPYHIVNKSEAVMYLPTPKPADMLNYYDMLLKSRALVGPHDDVSDWKTIEGILRRSI